MYYTQVEFISNSPGETKEIAADFAKNLKSNNAIIIVLEGELGAGKTTFIQGFTKALGIEDKVKSPTFTLMKQYGEHLYHLDCYRLKDEKDLEIFNIKEIFSDPKNIVLIEWAERVAKVLPDKYWTIHIEHIDETRRKIAITS